MTRYKHVKDMYQALERDLANINDRLNLDDPPWLVANHFHTDSFSTWKIGEDSKLCAMIDIHGSIIKLGGYTPDELEHIANSIKEGCK